MPPKESPEEKFDRLKRELQDSILRDYPNPARKGCPGGAVLRKLAEQPLYQAIEDDPHWRHVTHCSECYHEFLGFNEAFRLQTKVQTVRVRRRLAVAAVVVVLAGLVAVKQGSIFPKRPQNAGLAYTKRTILIPSMERSGDVDEQKPLFLERLPLELSVQLPVGSQAGVYELELKSNDRTVISTGGNAEIHYGTTAFSVKINLSSFAPGNYSLVVRQVPHDWNLYPVVIR